MNDILNALSSGRKDGVRVRVRVKGYKMGDFIEDNIRLDLAPINISSN